MNFNMTMPAQPIIIDHGRPPLALTVVLFVLWILYLPAGIAHMPRPEPVAWLSIACVFVASYLMYLFWP